MTARNQRGFAVTEILIVVVVVALIGLAGFLVFTRQNNKTALDTDPLSGQTAEASAEPSAPEINTTADLTKASNTLDTAALDDNSEAQALDAEMADL